MAAKSRFVRKVRVGKEEVIEEVERLRKLERKSFGPRHGRTDFYEYLGRVFENYIWWMSETGGVRMRVRRLLIDSYQLKERP